MVQAYDRPLWFSITILCAGYPVILCLLDFVFVPYFIKILEQLETFTLNKTNQKKAVARVCSVISNFFVGIPAIIFIYIYGIDYTLRDGVYSVTLTSKLVTDFVLLWYSSKHLIFWLSPRWSYPLNNFEQVHHIALAIAVSGFIFTTNNYNLMFAAVICILFVTFSWVDFFEIYRYGFAHDYYSKAQAFRYYYLFSIIKYYTFVLIPLSWIIYVTVESSETVGSMSYLITSLMFMGLPDIYLVHTIFPTIHQYYQHSSKLLQDQDNSYEKPSYGLEGMDGMNYAEEGYATGPTKDGTTHESISMPIIRQSTNKSVNTFHTIDIPSSVPNEDEPSPSEDASTQYPV